MVQVHCCSSRPVPYGPGLTEEQSLLHGSPEAKRDGDLEIQQHTRLVARGKYIHAFEGEFTFTVSFPISYEATSP